MKSRQLALQRGDVVACGSLHGVIVATRDRGGANEIFIVPIEWDVMPRHRADVPCADVQNPSLSFAGAVARCGEARWARLRADHSAGRLPPSLMQSLIGALRRERMARQVEELPPGIVRSHLGRGPKVGDRGRKVGGVPTD